MLSKLIKHEFTATGRIMVPTFLFVLLAAVGGNVSTYHLLETDNGLLNTLGLMMLSVFILALIASCLLAFALMIHRFYKNLLQDEGYLMMTLPVSVHDHILSKLIVSVLWFGATVLVIFLSVLVLIWQAEPMRLFFGELIELLSALKLSVDALHVVLVCLELLGTAILWSVCLCLQFYAALSIGHSFSGHKMLFSGIAYFALQFAMQLISLLLASAAAKLSVNQAIDTALKNMSDISALHLTLLAAMGIALLISAAHYAITAYFLKNRLNLN